MATLNIGGQRVKVDDGFLSMSPADQQKTVDEIEASLSGAPQPPASAAAAATTSPAVAAVPPAQSLETALPPTPGQTVISPDGSESWSPPAGSTPAVAPPIQTEPVPAPSSLADNIRQAKIVGQAAASGATSTAMLPLDVPSYGNAALNFGYRHTIDPILQGINQFVGKTILPTTLDADAASGRLAPGIGIPSERVKEGASWLAKQLGYEEAIPTTPGEKLLSNVVNLGTGAGTGAGVLSRLAKARELALTQPGALPSASDKFIRPYAANPIKTVIGDTAGGATAGAALTGSQEMPEWLRNYGGGSVGTMADLTAMLAGGVSGGTLASGVMRMPTTAGQAFRNSRPAMNIPVDPVTGAGTSNRVADELASIIQGRVTGDPKQVAADITNTVGSLRERGLPIPTTGIVTDNTGLASFEKGIRTQVGSGNVFPDAPPELQQSFVNRDTALRQGAADQVQSVLPPAPTAEEAAQAARAEALRARYRPNEKAPPPQNEIFQSRAADRAQMEMEARQREIDQAAGAERGVQTARQESAQPVRDQEGATPDASTRIFNTYDETRTLEQQRSDALYSNPAFTEHTFNIAPMQQTAAEIRARAAQPGRAAIGTETEDILQRIESAQATGTLTGSILKEMNKDIEKYISGGALVDGQSFQNLKELKNSIATAITQLPPGSPPLAAIQRARANSAEVIRPNFREDVGGSLDMRLKTNPGQVIPETAGAEFLQRGSSTRQLQDIGNLRGNAEQVAADSRAIMFDQLARSGAIKNGVLDPDALVSWRNRNNNIIREVPGLSDRVNNLIAASRQGAGKTSQYADEIAAAEKRLAETEKGLKSGPVGKIENKTPQEAVGTIMNGQNAVKNMTELKNKLGNNPAATQSLKDNVTQYFVDKISTTDVSLDNAVGVENVKNLIKDVNKHRATLVAAGFTPEQMNAVQQAQELLTPLTRRNVQATVGSTTAESTNAAMRPLELALKMHYGTLKGGSVFRNLKIAAKLLKGDSSEEINRLALRAMFDPDLAVTLLTRDAKAAGTPVWNAQLQKVLRRNVAAKELASPQEDQEQP